MLEYEERYTESSVLQNIFLGVFLIQTAVYPGSFDPITNGHLDVITRCSNIFDRVIVGVLVNSNKNPMFSLDERVAFIQQSVASLANVEALSFGGPLVEFAAQNNAKVIVRGLRAISDYEKELQMALFNKQLNPQIETFFIPTNSEYSYLSSSIVKEAAKYGLPVFNLVPETVLAALKKTNNI